ncbi:Golgi integral membrane protein [Trichinella pseudospiralis]
MLLNSFSEVQRMEQGKSENADDVTKQNKRRKRYGSEENNGENPDDRKCIADDTKQIADGTSGSRTARSRSKEDRRYAVPRGSQFFNDKPTWLRFELMQYLAFPAAKFMYAVAFMCRNSF